MPLNMVSMAIYVTLEGKIPRTPCSLSATFIPSDTIMVFIRTTPKPERLIKNKL